MTDSGTELIKKIIYFLSQHPALPFLYLVRHMAETNFVILCGLRYRSPHSCDYWHSWLI